MAAGASEPVIDRRSLNINMGHHHHEPDIRHVIAADEAAANE